MSAVVDPKKFRTQAETFSFDSAVREDLLLLRLLLKTPRVYGPFMRAFLKRNPSCKKTLRRWVSAGFVVHQPEVIMDTLTGLPAEKTSRKVSRFVCTKPGRDFLAEFDSDERVFSDVFPKTSRDHVYDVVDMLRSADLRKSHRLYGVSLYGMSKNGSMPERTVRWWVNSLVDNKFLRLLDEKHPDVRAVVPDHYRPTRLMVRQLRKAVEVFAPSEAEFYISEFKLGRTRLLGDVDPLRLGPNGVNDYDHDVNTQEVLARLFHSPHVDFDSALQVEPSFALLLDNSSAPFKLGGGFVKRYQPDAVFVSKTSTGQVVRNVLEYERFQTRSDGWSHLELFLLYVMDSTSGVGPAALRFVVDTKLKERSYVKLISGFYVYLSDYLNRSVPNDVTLYVSSRERLNALPLSTDVMDDSLWHSVKLPSCGSDCTPVWHPGKKNTPYKEFVLSGEGS